MNPRERNDPVLKTVRGNSHGGSNPSACAIKTNTIPRGWCLFLSRRTRGREPTSATKNVAEWGSHTPPEDRRARSSGAGWGYLRQRRIPLFIFIEPFVDYFSDI